MIKVIIIEPHNYSEEANSILRTFSQVDECALNREKLLEEISAYDVLITRLGHHINREVIDRGKNLKAIVTATTGLDHIDVEYAQEKGIVVLSLKGEHEFLRSIPATGEHTFALILALLRNIPAATNSVLDGKWDRDLFIGRDLEGRRLGLVGVGRVGQKVAQIAQGFNMQVSGYDPSPDQTISHVEYLSSLEELLSWAEIISVHVPLNSETSLLISEPELSMMRPGSYFINTSRGMVVDEEALMAKLAQGHLAGAALDVIHSEQEIQTGVTSPLIEYAKVNKNLILTPHIGGATLDSMHKTEIFMAQKLRDYFSGRYAKQTRSVDDQN
jgi:D-3-phosphoglycerate dehydrogenase